MGQRSAAAGFTLLEVLVAMVLLSLTLTLAFAGLQQSARGWQAQIDHSARIELGAAVDDLLRRQLLLALAGEEQTGATQADAKPVFEGDARRAQWIAPLAAAGVGAGLYRIALELESGQNGDRLVFEYALYDPASERTRPQWQRRVLLESLPALRIDYWGRSGLAQALEWHERWEPQTPVAPLLLRLRVLEAHRDGEWGEWIAPVSAAALRS